MSSVNASHQRPSLELTGQLLARLLKAEQPSSLHFPSPHARSRAEIKVAGFTFAVEWRTSGTVATIAPAINHAITAARALGPHTIPLIAAPFLGPTTRQRCEAAGVSWIDLSGNAELSAPGLQVSIRGFPNKFKQVGRPASPFAPKSSRIARWLIMNPERFQSQREIAQATQMDEGFTSRLIARLESDNLVTRAPDGKLRAKDPNLLLDAWEEVYDFSKHHTIKGHVPASSGESLLRDLAVALREEDIPYAATGLGAAWLLSRFASFRTTSVYLTTAPTAALLKRLRFREEERGANTWLIIPKDEGVFQGSSLREEIECVHPVQVYLDLKAHPERAREAGQHLREELLTWSHND